MADNRKTRGVALASILLVTLSVSLSGCVVDSDIPNPTVDTDYVGAPSGQVHELDVTLRDGRVVHCLYLEAVDSLGSSGLSCDWLNAVKPSL